MAEPRGRGRAALFAKSLGASDSNDPVPIGRGRAGAIPEEPKPKGRGAIFRHTLSAGDSSSSSAYLDISDDRTEASGSTFVTGTVLSAANSGTAITSSSSSSNDSLTRKGKGRASLFGPKASGVRDISEDMAQLKIAQEPAPRVCQQSPEKKEPVKMHGQQGRKISATANYIRFEFIDRTRGINEYEVTFYPEVDNVRERAYILGQQFKEFGGNVRVYDMGWRIFTPDTLHKEVSTATVTLRSGLEVRMTVTFKRTKTFDECRYVLNILFKRIMNELQLVKFGRSDFNPNAAVTIPEHRLSIWPGCITAIDEYEGGVMLCCDASHRVLRSQSCLDIIGEISQISLSGQRRTDIKSDIQQALIGLSVIANYNKKIYKIDDIDFESNPLKTFERGNEKISFVEYYRTQYNIDIKDKNQPMLVHRAKKKALGKEKVDILIYLVPELCSPTGLTDEMRSNFRLMKKVADITRVSPLQRQNALREFIRGIKSNPKAQKLLEDWNLKLPDTTIDLIARVMEPERVYFGNKQSVQEVNADWGRAAANNHVLSPIDLHNWSVIYTSRDSRIVSEFTTVLNDCARKIGIRVNRPHSVQIGNDHAKTYCEEIRKLAQNRVQLIVIVFPTLRDDRYSAVKKLLNCDLGIPSQVVNSKTISVPKKLRSVVTKIILQINCKIGGALWGVTIPYKEEGVMFCGIDAYHEANRQKNSVIALVTSMNDTCTRWTSGTAFHNKGQEITDLLTGLLKNCLEMWHKTNNAFPARIVMFRDGVGDGQLPVVRDYEVPQFYNLFKRIKSDYGPKLTYIVVQKRINTRLYKKEHNKFDNPPPGTVIDHTVTRRDWFDYFLVSQNVCQGTVSPTHYVVVYDDSNMPVDIIQKLSYKMTHLYYNWNGTVRVPAPCQYAHKLAYLVGQHMRGPAVDHLNSLLYYL